MNKFKQNWLVAVLCWAVLFVSLVPSLKAIATKPAVDSLFWEVCSVTPGKASRAQSLPPNPKAPVSGHHEHCPTCASHGANLIAPPVAALFFASIESASIISSPFHQSSMAQHVWIEPPSRAPPR